MESQQRSDDLALRALDLWPPNDTEESISGTDLHQTTIINLRIGLNEAAQICLCPGTRAARCSY